MTNPGPLIAVSLPAEDPAVWRQWLHRTNALDAHAHCVDEALRQTRSVLQDAFSGDRAAVVCCTQADEQANEVLGRWRPVWFDNDMSPKVQRMLRPLVRRMRWTLGELPSNVTPPVAMRDVPAASVISVSDYPARSSHRAVAALTGTEHRLFLWVPVDTTYGVVLLVDRARGRAPFTQDDAHEGVLAATHLQRHARRWMRQLGILNGTVLSPRERSVLALLLRGDSEKAAAEFLGLTPASLHQVVVRVYRALGVTSRGELSHLCLMPQDDVASWESKTLLGEL